MSDRLAPLQEWDLSDLYRSITDPQIELDLDHAFELSRDFEKHYHGFFVKGYWSPKDLKMALFSYEEVNEILGRVMSFVGLVRYKCLNDSSVALVYQRLSERVTKINQMFVFFSIELNKICEKRLHEAYASDLELARYKPYLDQVRLLRPHQLEESLEKLILDKDLTAEQAWIRLYDESLEQLRFHHKGETLSLEKVINLMSHGDVAIRREAALVLSEGLNSQLHLFTFIMNTLAKSKHVDDVWRAYKTPMHNRHIQNQITPESVEVLVQCVKESYPKLTHRYYALKAEILNVPFLEYWDRNAPLPFDEECFIPFSEAKDIVLEAYGRFSPLLKEIALKFFENKWIDVPVVDGKTSGAFSHPTVPSVHPYILLNYQGKTRDVMTLAHELGHGCHQYLARDQGLLLSDTPLTLAETASVFGEMLTFRLLLDRATSPRDKIVLLCKKVEDMLNTVVRQIAFYEFERLVHTRRREDELTSDELGTLWVETQKEALGEFVRVDPLIRPYWAYISHFIHSPFYVYAYAFGDCLVNSLYRVYERNPNGFEETYINLLKAGGSRLYTDLLKDFGLDPSDATFWHQGLSMIESFIDEIEHLQGNTLIKEAI